MKYSHSEGAKTRLAKKRKLNHIGLANVHCDVLNTEEETRKLKNNYRLTAFLEDIEEERNLIESEKQ